MPFDQDLSKEQKLFDIWRIAVDFEWPRINFWALISALTISSLYAFAIVANDRDVSTRTLHLAEVGVSYSASILGFLIAGFTIFMSSVKPRLITLLSNIEHDKAKISWLKFMLFVYVRVFVEYLAFTGVCISLLIYGGTEGFFYKILQLAFSDNSIVCMVEIRFEFVLVATFFVHTLFLLKSFVVNIYKTFLLPIVQRNIEDEKSMANQAIESQE